MKFRRMCLAVVCGALLAAVPVRAGGFPGLPDKLVETILDKLGSGEEKTAENASEPESEEPSADTESGKTETVGQVSGEVDITDLSGEWDYVSYEGNPRYQFNGDLFLMPDRTISGVFFESDEGSTALETAFKTLSFDDTETTGIYKVGVPDALSEDVREIKISYETLAGATEERDTDSRLTETEAGTACIRMTVTAAPTDNPLGSDEETETVFIRSKNQEVFLEKLMAGKIWETGGKNLTISRENRLDLNDGKVTGQCRYYSDDENSMIVELQWDSGKSYRYIPTGFSDSTITLQNIDDPSDLMEFTYKGTYIELAFQLPDGTTVLNEDHIVSASVKTQTDSVGEPEYAVYIVFDEEGGAIFKEVTTEHAGERLFIAVNGEIVSAPLIREPITDGDCTINGSFTKESAEELAAFLDRQR